MNSDEIEIYRNTLLLKHYGYEYCIETSISWVLLCKEYVFKIKKPVNLGFLNYSTLDGRKRMCENEVELNTRFSSDVYLGVVAVRRDQEGVYSHHRGELVDYAVKMRKLDHRYLLSNQMKVNALSESTMVKLSTTVAKIHNQAPIVPKKIDIEQQYEKIKLVMQLTEQMKYIGLQEFEEVPVLCVRSARKYLHTFSDLFINRKEAIRECHGDMHSENIFVFPDRIEVIDCIEFRDEYRYIDVLDDISATLTDLECYGQQRNTDLFLKTYIQNVEVSVEPILLHYFKLQRAVTRFSANVLLGHVGKSKIYLHKMSQYAVNLMKLSN